MDYSDLPGFIEVLFVLFLSDKFRVSLLSVHSLSKVGLRLKKLCVAFRFRCRC